MYYRLGMQRYMKQINDIREWQKKLAEFRHSVEIVHVWKESGITTQGLNELFFYINY